LVEVMEHTELLDVVVERLVGADLPGPVSSLVLAAVLGDQELAQALGGTRPLPPIDDRAESARTSRMYLSSVAVEGFRGIAGKAQLGLQPGPGLTLVVGRNGSGKSSFAEAAELALTGTSLRWASGRAKVWQEGWHNLHHAGPRSIEVRLSVDGRAGQRVVRRAWAATDGLEAGSATVQEPGGPIDPLTAARLGPALATYRPFLSYNELGTLLEEGPSKLYDAISQVLGLELLVNGEARLTGARKALEDVVKVAKGEAQRLAGMLDGHPDPRAETCRQALAKRPGWDVDAIERTIAGDPGAAGSRLEQLERLARLPAPSPDALAGLAAELRLAAAGLAAVAGTDAARAGEVADLLGRALAVHRHGGGDCPVCGTTHGGRKPRPRCSAYAGRRGPLMRPPAKHSRPGVTLFAWSGRHRRCSPTPTGSSIPPLPERHGRAGPHPKVTTSTSSPRTSRRAVPPSCSRSKLCAHGRPRGSKKATRHGSR